MPKPTTPRTASPTSRTADSSLSGFEPVHRFNSNSLSASFVGVNASYGFDGGWKPGITLETFVRFQDFKTGRNDNDPVLSRKAFVSLASNYGALSVGRLQTLLFDTTARFNAMGNSPGVLAGDPAHLPERQSRRRAARLLLEPRRRLRVAELGGRDRQCDVRARAQPRSQ